MIVLKGKTKMLVIKNENTVFFDVDNTLILCASEYICHKKIWVYDPITNSKIEVAVHGSMIRLLREEHHRGSHVIVWSRGGYEWASNVIRALDLENYVHLVMTKPMAYFDDIPIETWLTNRVYFEPNLHKKYKGE